MKFGEWSIAACCNSTCGVIILNQSHVYTCKSISGLTTFKACALLTRDNSPHEHISGGWQRRHQVPILWTEC